MGRFLVEREMATNQPRVDAIPAPLEQAVAVVALFIERLIEIDHGRMGSVLQGVCPSVRNERQVTPLQHGLLPVRRDQAVALDDDMENDIPRYSPARRVPTGRETTRGSRDSLQARRSTEFGSVRP